MITVFCEMYSPKQAELQCYGVTMEVLRGRAVGTQEIRREVIQYALRNVAGTKPLGEGFLSHSRCCGASGLWYPAKYFQLYFVAS